MNLKVECQCNDKEIEDVFELHICHHACPDHLNYKGVHAGNAEIKTDTTYP